MKIPAVLWAARRSGREPVPFQEILPLKLKPMVSGKVGSVTEVSCVYEMSVMLACFKTNEFSQDLCSKEIDSFQKCYQDHLTATQMKKEKQAKGVLTPGDKKLSAKQVNMLLKRHPNFE